MFGTDKNQKHETSMQNSFLCKIWGEIGENLVENYLNKFENLIA